MPNYYPQVIPLAPEDAMFGLATHKVVITAAMLAGLGAGATLTLQLFPAQTPSQFAAGTAPTGTNPVGLIARFAGMHLVTAFDFSDSSINSLLAEIGDGGDTDRLMTQKQLAVDGTEVLEWAEAATTQPYAYPIVDTIDLLLTAAGGGDPTVQEATSGEVEFYLHLSRPATRA
jgi:hypothetical protein